jgi:anti-sigma factor RsiW
MTISAHDELLLNAYLDGELAPLDAADFEERLAGDATLAAEVKARRGLRATLRSTLADDVPSGDLRRRILAGVAPPSAVKTRPWRSLAASFLLGAMLAGTATLGVMHDRGGEDVAGEVVSAHIRALMAPQPIDVPSSDRHTVKPWFAGKLAFAPKVVDLAAQGFPLTGGRIDVVGLEPVASLAYRNGKHLISVTEMPNAKGLAAPVATHVERGYLALSWSDGEVIYWAVSDAAPDELHGFVHLFQTAAAQP